MSDYYRTLHYFANLIRCIKRIVIIEGKMKLESLRIVNLRSIEDQTINFNDYTCFVGANGSGKSTVLCALNILFRESNDSNLDYKVLDKEDFHNGDTTSPIFIYATFSDLSEQAKSDFANYYRQGKLLIVAIAEYDASSGSAIVKQHGQRLGITKFKTFFKMANDSKPVSELRTEYNIMKDSIPDLPNQTVKQRMIDALHEYEEHNPDQCEELTSEDEFYGFTRGANLLAKHIQWIYIPAVKDATNEQTEGKNTALGKILTRTVRAKINFEEPINDLRDETKKKYEDLLGKSQSELSQLSNSLEKRIKEWAHPEVTVNLEWQLDQDKTVKIEEPFAQIITGEGCFSGNLARFGHGLQRSYLLALLQELSLIDTENSPTLLLGCEEPELYQHPPQIRHLAEVLQNLSEKNSQIIVTTHNPIFVKGNTFENVRYVRKDMEDSKSEISQVNFVEIDEIFSCVCEQKLFKPEGLLAKIHQSLQPSLNEIFFTNKLILVEGLEDIAYLTTYFHLLELYDEYRKLGFHMVPTNGKSNMILPYCIAKKLNIPTYIVFDSDGHNYKEEDPHGHKAKHKKDNLALLKLSGIESPEPFPEDSFWDDNVVMWNSEIGDIIKSEFDEEEWNKYCQATRKKYANVKDLHKNCLFIADTLEAAWNDGKKSESLEKLCLHIIEFANNV